MFEYQPQQEIVYHVPAKSDQYETDHNLALRQAFNALPKENPVNTFVLLGNYYVDRGIVDIPGDTLEIGGGNGYLWKQAGHIFFDAMAQQGRIHITDFSSGMIEACKQVELLNHPKVTLRTADVTNLPYEDASYARVIGNFMMYECRTAENVEKGIKEIVRILKDDGHALFMTMDEQIHMIQLWKTMQQAKEQLKKQGIAIDVEIPSYSSALKVFCAGNAPGYLEKAFGKIAVTEYHNTILVERVIRISDVTISGVEFVVKYLQSLEFVQTAMKANQFPEEFFDAIRSIVSEEIEKNGVFKISRCDILYDCSEPKRN
jgi:2-polyprenyl-3-methyl-5-hydroxy-6-metoxy-1,4-benzoquinol methylase